MPRAVSSCAISRVVMPDAASSARRPLIWLARSKAAAWLAAASRSAFRPSRTPRALAAFCKPESGLAADNKNAQPSPDGISGGC